MNSDYSTNYCGHILKFDKDKIHSISYKNTECEIEPTGQKDIAKMVHRIFGFIDQVK